MQKEVNKSECVCVRLSKPRLDMFNKMKKDTGLGNTELFMQALACLELVRTSKENCVYCNDLIAKSMACSGIKTQDLGVVVKSLAGVKIC